MQPIFKQSFAVACKKGIQGIKGFTLIELVIVIVLMGGVATLVSTIFANPFIQYETLSRRASIVSLGNAAIARMEHDFKNAIPNSVRQPSGSTQLIEFMNISDGGRYRYTDDSDNSEADALSPGYVDSSFRTFGNLSNSPVNSDNEITGVRLVVNSFNTTALYIAATDGELGIITPADTEISRINPTDDAGTIISDEDEIRLNPGFQFDLLGNGSPRKRFYLTDTGIIYRCDLTNAPNGEIIRYTNYEIQRDLYDNSPNGSPNAALLINQVSACEFKYETGIAQRLGLVTIAFTLRDSLNNEEISFVKQLRVSNVP